MVFIHSWLPRLCEVMRCTGLYATVSTLKAETESLVWAIIEKGKSNNVKVITPLFIIGIFIYNFGKYLTHKLMP